MSKTLNQDFLARLSSGGLSESQVLKIQEQYGYNELPKSKVKRGYLIILDVLKEPMVYILLSCGLIYYIIGDRQEAIMLLVFLLIIIGITIVQEAKAERALEALRDLSSPRANVLRDNSKKRVAGREVVLGDIIYLAEGDKVPADAEVISSYFLTSDESLLTGEALPVEKKIGSTIYAGTTIVRGQGIAGVLEIGIKTEIGKIGNLIQGDLGVVTSLEMQTNHLVKKTAWVAVVICIAVVVAYAFTHEDWLQGFLNGLSLAMAIMPNELPAVLAIFLALGAWRISKRRVLTRNISAIENLGAATVLCVDKTGTLTMNQMTIQKIYSKNCTVNLDDNLSNLGEEFHEALEYGILASRMDPFDPMELAFLNAGARFLEGTEHLHRDWLLKKEYPISSELLSITQAWKPKPEGGFIIGAKGAPEAIVDLCHLSPLETERHLKIAESMASEGLRVLGVAKAFSDDIPLPEKQHDFDFSFVGYIGITDPVRESVPAAIKECKKAGIRIIMITGDHPLTATSIAGKIGLVNSGKVLTGSELELTSDEELQNIIKDVNVFSRVTPTQKLRLVNCIKSSGEIVAMTGDGVNDAPALKSADIGIAMGGRGTDVAREAADLVLLDDDFSSIVESIKMGRRIYANLRSALIYLFAIHIPIAGISIFPAFFNLPLVLFPIHIAFLHLIIEPVSSVAFEIEEAAPGIMSEPPRNRNKKLFDKDIWRSSGIMGGSILLALILIYYISLTKGQGEKDARTLVYTTLIIANIGLILLSNDSHLSVAQKIKLRLNKVVKIIIPLSLLMLVLVLYVSKLREMFSFSFLHISDLILCVFLGFGAVAWIELMPRQIIQPSMKKLMKKLHFK